MTKCSRCGRELKSDIERKINKCTKCLTFKGSIAKWKSLTNWEKAGYLYVRFEEEY